MAEHIKFISVTRVIDPKTRIHYLDAVDTNGTHWMCQMEHDSEPHLIYKRVCTPEFLSTLHSAVECCGWDVDAMEIEE